MKDHTYEEIRSAAIDRLSDREPRYSYQADQFLNFRAEVAAIINKRDPCPIPDSGRPPNLSSSDNDLFQEVFWDLFRQGIITLGSSNSSEGYPFFRLATFAKKTLANNDLYFFHDVSSYEKAIQDAVPKINKVTLDYLKEAMQDFRSGCFLSASVLMGVALEHSFDLLIESVDKNSKYQSIFKSVSNERTIYKRTNAFKKIIEQHLKELPPSTKDDLETNFSGIFSIIRNYRNESGHPSEIFIEREQCYVNLQLVIHCIKKIYQLKEFFEQKT
jgi:hypothetical protein